MTLAYPIFVRDSYNGVTLVRAAEDLEGEIELPDAEAGENHGWDSRGIPFRIGVKNERVVVCDIGDVPKPEALHSLLLDLAAKYEVLPEIVAKFGDAVAATNPLEMYEEIERMKPGLAKRLSRLWRRVVGRVAEG